MATEVGSLLVSLTADARGLREGLSIAGRDLARFETTAEKSVGGLGQRMAAGLRGAGGVMRTALTGALTGAVGGAIAAVSFEVFTGKVRDAIKSVAELKAEASRAGVDVETFQGLKYAAEQSKVSVDALTDGLKEMQLRADELVLTGAGPAAEAFARLGFSADDLKRRLEDPTQLFLEITRRLSQLQDTAARIRIADEIFGGTGGEQFLRFLDAGDDGIRAMMATARETGQVLDEEIVARAAEIDAEFSRIASTIGTAVKGAIVDVVATTADWLAQLRAGIEAADAAGNRQKAVTVALNAAGIATVDQKSDARGRLADALQDGVSTTDFFFRDDVVRPATEVTATTPPPKKTSTRGGGGGAVRDQFAPLIQSLERRVQQLQLEAQTFNQTGAAVEAYRVEQELLAQAQQAGVTLSAAQRERVAALAGSYGALSDQLDAARSRQQALDETMSFFGDQTLSVFRAMRQGGDALRSTLQSMAGALADAALQAALLGQGPLAGLFGTQAVGGGVGGLFGILGGALRGPAPATAAAAPAGGGILSTILGFILHDGGTVGATSAVRAMPAGAFAGAPRFHNGLKSDELPAILQKGERVLTARQWDRTVSTMSGLAARGRSIADNRSVSYRGGDVNISGNVTEDVLPQVRAMIAESNAEQQRNLRRNFGTFASDYQKRRG